MLANDLRQAVDYASEGGVSPGMASVRGSALHCGAVGGGRSQDGLLQRIAAERLLRLTTRGRRSGLPRAVTIWFVVDGEAIGIGTLNDERHWVRNVRQEPAVELEIGALRLRGRLRQVVDPAEHARLRQLMARKYWPARIASWFGIGQRFTFRIDDVAAFEPSAGA